MASEAILSSISFHHDVLSHAPLVLFLLCPLLIVVGAALPPLRARPWLLAALLSLGLGTASLFVAMPGGGVEDSAVAVGNPAAGAVLWIYRSLTAEARLIFIGLTAIYVGVILLPELLRRRDNRLFSTVLPLSFLVLYSAGAVFLIQTADSAAAVAQKLGVDAAATAPPSSSGDPPHQQESQE